MSQALNPHQLSITSRLLYEEAVARGIYCQLFDDPHLIQMTKWGKTWFTRGSRTSLQSSVGHSIATNKELAKQVLKANKIPTSDFVILRDKSDIEKLKRLNFPLVLKPTNFNQGEDVHIGIKTTEEVTELFDKLITKHPRGLLCEEQIYGKEYRLLFIDFKFVGAIYRKPAHVTGNGHMTIQQLIEEKNDDPRRSRDHSTALSKIKVDQRVRDFLTEQKLDFDYIPPKDKDIYLHQASNVSLGGEPVSCQDPIHPSILKFAERAARICDLNVVGIDFMCEDITQEPDLKRSGIIEVNSSPGFRMHYFPLEGPSINVAQIVLDMIEKHHQELPDATQ